jgi:hypothetical protein
MHFTENNKMFDHGYDDISRFKASYLAILSNNLDSATLAGITDEKSNGV